VKWILEGGSNTGYFHSITNGRRRKCMIDFLDTEHGRIFEQKELMATIYEFYRKLFEKKDRGLDRLERGVWREKAMISSEKAEWLIRLFTV
jgi:hypothetical protein